MRQSTGPSVGKVFCYDVAVLQHSERSPDHVLDDVVAWLVINSLRSEQTQWVMLCIQNISNLYRKNAFRTLLKHTKFFLEGQVGPVIDKPLSQDRNEFEDMSDSDFTLTLDKKRALEVSGLNKQLVLSLNKQVF